MRFEASDSHHHRLAGFSARHVLVPRDELEYVMCQVYSVEEGESRGILEIRRHQFYNLARKP